MALCAVGGVVLLLTRVDVNKSNTELHFKNVNNGKHQAVY